jgi:hypothetical protein
MLSLTVAGTTKSYELDNVQSVVEMFRDRFEGIPETTFESAKRFENRAQQEKVVQQKEASKKHYRNEDEETGRKLQIIEGTTLDKSKTVEFGKKTPGTSDTLQERLCIFNLKFQLLKDQPDCRLGDDCTRTHYRKSLRESDDYHWNAKTVTDEINLARTFIISEADKIKLLEVVERVFT